MHVGIAEFAEIMIYIDESSDEISARFGQIACQSLDMHNSLVSSWISLKLGAFDSHCRDYNRDGREPSRHW